MLKFIEYKQINKQKWEALVLHSNNGNIYSTVNYLDCMAKEWHIVILGDYKGGIALPARKKLGISYIYPPFFTQQLGWLFVEEKYNLSIDEVLKYIPPKFKLIEHNLNSENFFRQTNGLMFRPRLNYLLSLNKTFIELFNSFSRSAIRNIKKATTANVSVKKNIQWEEIYALHHQRFNNQTGVDQRSYDNFRRLLQLLYNNKMLFTLGAYNKNKEIISGGIFTIFKNRVTFILNGNLPESLENGATHLLLCEAIKHFSNKDLTLDFEGSDTPSFARFYEQYGAEPETYYLLTSNKLPAIVKFISGKKS